ncbi:MAG: excinuclease ABC subunit UvrA [Candidatus Uhrbacteria bacterium]|nr:excinuclease ABC subunit UvrA [Candidatus Uhrbacteria bacterium]
MIDSIIVKGARVNNLKNVSVVIPRNALVVFTGLSGSGKSSLAFDTIYAEGQRRFMEGLSSYTKQFLENIDKPDVDQIEGLPPTIAIDQRTASSSPRSTVGTSTEIYDYLRLLFARLGTPHCPSCGKEITSKSRQTIITSVIDILKKSTKPLALLAPLYANDALNVDRLLEEFEKLHIYSVRVDRKSYTLKELLAARLDTDTNHSLDIVVDLFSRPELDVRDTNHVVRSINRALELGDGTLVLWSNATKEEHLFTEKLVCPSCAVHIEPLEPRHFSFNNPVGACLKCTGLGYLMQFDADLLVPNRKLTIAQGAIQPLNKLYTNTHHLFSDIDGALERVGSSINIPLSDFSKDQEDFLLFGKVKKVQKKSSANNSPFTGIIPYLEKKYQESDSDYIKKELEEYMLTTLCPTCSGKRLKPQARAVRVAGYSIDELVALSIDKLIELFQSLTLQKKSLLSDERNRAIATPIIEQIVQRARALKKVGLHYVVLDRNTATLSGGEAQRVKLANHLSTSLVGVVYVLDEPSIGLHPRDTEKLIETLRDLQHLGNTVLVVEHDKSIIMAADRVIDVGPRAGKNGGTIVAQGTASDIMKNKQSITGRYLSGARSITLTKKPRASRAGHIEIIDAHEFNLQHVSVRIPLGNLIAVTGVSGSGKSTLIIEILSKALMKKLYRAKDVPGKHGDITGIEHIDKAIVIDQTPIGRTPRSNPVTYTNIFTSIRELYTNLPESKIKGFTPGHFSFNVKGGRCETCQGEGMMRIDMRFLSDVFVECRDCGGKRYTKEALEVHYEGLSIADVLDLTVDEALTFFARHPGIHDKLKTLSDVGLGYIRLGQPAPTLSGGEAQRIKLAAELSRRSTGKTLTILDEPTTGLHFEDVQQLLSVLNQLVEKGNTVLMIEHNLDVIKNADWVIDLGPEGGTQGGQVVAQGTPEDIAKNPKSITGKYLKDVKPPRP